MSVLSFLGGVAIGTVFGASIKALWEKYVSPKIDAAKQELDGGL